MWLLALALALGLVASGPAGAQPRGGDDGRPDAAAGRRPAVQPMPGDAGEGSVDDGFAPDDTEPEAPPDPSDEDRAIPGRPGALETEEPDAPPAAVAPAPGPAGPALPAQPMRGG
jgi:hypothetical protein